MNCEQHVGAGTCPNPAAAIWTWVTGDKVAVCLDHKVAARAIAQAMGYAAIFTEIPCESGDEDELSRLQERLTLSRCSFCGSEMPRAESAGHMLSCEKHPIAALMKDRDEWRTKALDAGKHPAVVALVKELDAARAELKDARRGEAGLREALRRAWASIHDGCEPAAALNPAKCHPFCSEIRKALAGELAGEVGT